MTDPSITRTWAVRTDRDHRSDLILPEMRKGALRQGWGYTPEQDLRLVRSRLQAGETLGWDERTAWSHNWRLLPDEQDGIAAGDWILLPNLPDDGLWTIARAQEAYSFELAITGDHGHTRSIEVVREGIDPLAAGAAAPLRRSMRCQRALWNLDHLAVEVARLGADAEPSPPALIGLEAVSFAARQAAWMVLQREFGGAELEHPIAISLRGIYAEVEEWGGPSEAGADLICRGADPMGLPTATAIQVKMWDGIACDRTPVDQLAQAYRSHDGLTGLAVVTTAESGSSEFEGALRNLEQEVRVPVRVFYRRDLIDLLLASVRRVPCPSTESEA